MISNDKQIKAAVSDVSPLSTASCNQTMKASMQSKAKHRQEAEMAANGKHSAKR